MKPYNERLPLIDEAIEHYKGEFPQSTDTEDDYWLKPTGILIKKLYIGFVHVCTPEEFEQRKAQWYKLYSWCMCTDQLKFEDFLSSSFPRGWAVACAKLGGFNWQDTLDQQPTTNKKEENMNDWYEKGELPPHNTECEVKIEGQWLPTVVIGHYANEVVVVDPCVTIQRFFCTTLNNIRPLRSETDKLVEQAMSLFSETEATTDAKQGIEHAVRKLINAGYRKIKPMTEDEFVNHSELDDDYGRILYREGCRFLDRGE